MKDLGEELLHMHWTARWAIYFFALVAPGAALVVYLLLLVDEAEDEELIAKSMPSKSGP